MVGVAILGAGIFAREEHIPGIEALPDVHLKAIWSRSLSSAEALASGLTSPAKPDLYHSDPSDPARTLDALLARDDISAVIVCLPILAQPDVIKKALSAGKHVLSEKPIAKDVASADALLSWYDALPRDGRPVWAVAENFRLMRSLLAAADTLRHIGGRVVTFSLSVFSLVKDESKYYNTAWRKTPAYQGGFLLDGGVHHVAALRLLLGAAGGDDVASLVAQTALLQEKLAPVDTIHAVLTTRGGVHGTASISFGTEFKSGFEAQVVTTEGSITVSPTKMEWTSRGKEKQTQEFPWNAGVQAEIEAFVKSLPGGVADPRQTGQQALADLKVIEGILKSGEKGGERQVL